MTIDRTKFIDFINTLSPESWDNFCKAYGFAGSAGAPAEDELFSSVYEPGASTKHEFKVAKDSANQRTRSFSKRWGKRVADLPVSESNGGR